MPVGRKVNNKNIRKCRHFDKSAIKSREKIVQNCKNSTIFKNTKTLQLNFVCDHTSSANKVLHIYSCSNSLAFNEDLLYDHCCSDFAGIISLPFSIGRWILSVGLRIFVFCSLFFLN